VPAHDGEAEEQEGGGGDGTGPEGFSAAEQKVDEDQAREKLEGGGNTEGDAGGEVAILAEVVPGQGHEEGEDHADLAVAEYDPEREPADESAEEDGGEARVKLRPLLRSLTVPARAAREVNPKNN